MHGERKREEEAKLEFQTIKYNHVHFYSEKFKILHWSTGNIKLPKNMEKNNTWTNLREVLGLRLTCFCRSFLSERERECVCVSLWIYTISEDRAVKERKKPSLSLNLSLFLYLSSSFLLWLLLSFWQWTSRPSQHSTPTHYPPLAAGSSWGPTCSLAPETSSFAPWNPFRLRP